MSLGPKSNFIPVVYAGTKKKNDIKKNKNKKKKMDIMKKIHARRTST